MIKLNWRKTSRISVNKYINLWDKDNVDIFIIINEANDTNDQIMKNAISFMEEVSAEYNLNEISNKDIEEEMERFFPYGVQIIRK